MCILFFTLPFEKRVYAFIPVFAFWIIYYAWIYMEKRETTKGNDLTVNQRQATSNDYEDILKLWEKSVFATHDFVKFEDWQEIKKEIPSYLPHLDVRIWYIDDLMIGFSSINNHQLEMLFLNPDEIGKGYGAKILITLINDFKVETVDVNKDNEQAKRFYLKHGFMVVSEDETDSAGRPYPILHLKLKDT